MKVNNKNQIKMKIEHLNKSLKKKVLIKKIYKEKFKIIVNKNLAMKWKQKMKNQMIHNKKCKLKIKILNKNK